MATKTTVKINATTDQFNKKFDYYYGYIRREIYEKDRIPRNYDAYIEWGKIRLYATDKMSRKYLTALMIHRMKDIDNPDELYAFALTWKYFIDDAENNAKKPTEKKAVKVKAKAKTEPKKKTTAKKTTVKRK